MDYAPAAMDMFMDWPMVVPMVEAVSDWLKPMILAALACGHTHRG